MSNPSIHKLNICQICDATIQKTQTESWITYGNKTACSMKCAAILREKKIRMKEIASISLQQAMNGWKVSA